MACRREGWADAPPSVITLSACRRRSHALAGMASSMHSLPLQVTVLLSLMLWGSMWGPVGMVLSVSTHGPPLSTVRAVTSQSVTGDRNTFCCTLVQHFDYVGTLLTNAAIRRTTVQHSARCRIMLHRVATHL